MFWNLFQYIICSHSSKTLGNAYLQNLAPIPVSINPDFLSCLPSLPQLTMFIRFFIVLHCLHKHRKNKYFPLSVTQKLVLFYSSVAVFNFFF